MARGESGPLPGIHADVHARLHGSAPSTKEKPRRLGRGEAGGWDGVLGRVDELNKVSQLFDGFTAWRFLGIASDYIKRAIWIQIVNHKGSALPVSLFLRGGLHGGQFNHARFLSYAKDAG